MDDAWGLDLNAIKGRSSDFRFNRQQYSTRKWEGEDEEDYVMDSWDQEPEDVEGEASRTSGLDRSEDTSTDNGLPPSEVGDSPRRSEETLDRIYIRKLQEEEDLNLAKDVFGVQTVLDTEESYDKFKVKLKSVIEDANKNAHYASFTEDVVQTLCNHLSSNELKRLVIRLSNLQIQKNSTKKGDKKKPKGKLKVKLRVEDDIHDYNEYSAYLEDDGYM